MSIFQKTKMLAVMATISPSISTKAQKGFLSPKNSMDHRTFSKICIPKAPMAILFFQTPFLMTRYRDTPIRTKRVIHTGENTQFGGLNDGLVNSWYHVETEDDVKIVKSVIESLGKFFVHGMAAAITLFAKFSTWPLAGGRRVGSAYRKSGCRNLIPSLLVSNWWLRLTRVIP